MFFIKPFLKSHFQHPITIVPNTYTQIFVDPPCNPTPKIHFIPPLVHKSFMKKVHNLDLHTYTCPLEFSRKKICQKYSMRHIRWANNKAHPVSSWGCATDPNSGIMSQNGHDEGVWSMEEAKGEAWNYANKNHEVDLKLYNNAASD